MKTKKLWAALMALAMAISLLPAAAFADGGTTTVTKTPVTETKTGQLQSSRYDSDSNKWLATESLSKEGDVYTFRDEANDVYESVGSLNFEAPDKKWEGDTTVEIEVYIDPAQFGVGEGFAMVCDIMPTWRAYVASIRKTDESTVKVSFTNNTDNFYVVNNASGAFSITRAGYYTFQWKIFDQSGKVACELYINNTKVGSTLTDTADTISNSYIRKFYIQTYAPQSGTNKETCSGKALQFKDVTKTVVTHYEWEVNSAEELTAALAAAKDGDTILLLNSFEMSKTILMNTDKTLTIDLNNNMLIYKGAPVNNNVPPLVQVEKGANLTLKNGWIEANTVNEGANAMLVKESGTLTLDNVDFTTTGNGITTAFDNAKVNIINRSRVTAGCWPVATYRSGANQVITITDSNIKATEKGWGTAILVNQPDVTLEITRSVVTGYRHGVLVRNGKEVTISKSLIENIVNQEKWVGMYENEQWAGGNGAPTGALVIGEKRDNATTNIKVTLDDSTIQSNGTYGDQTNGIYAWAKNDENQKVELTTKNTSIFGKITFPNEDDVTSGEGSSKLVTVTFLKDNVVLSRRSVTEGTTILMPEGPTKQGYEFKGWKSSANGYLYQYMNGAPISVDTIFTAVYEIIVPPVSGHAISIVTDGNGTVTTTPVRAEAGETVTINVTPNAGYEVADITVTAVTGETIAVSGNRFTMPSASVTVKVTFVRTSSPFFDVTAGDWFYEEVLWAYENNVMDGVGGGKFAPNSSVSRAMVWTVLARIDGKVISGSDWADEARAWAMAEGVSDGTMATGNVTREQLATMLYRYAKSQGWDVSIGEDTNILSYSDADQVSDWAVEAMQWACGTGIINGMDGKLNPQGGATRAQMAAMLMRFVAVK